GVAQPAVAVVPVADASNLLWKRRRWGCDDCAGGSICERFERDERTQDFVTPSPLVFAAAGPVTPKGFGLSQRDPRVDGVGRLAIGVSPAGNERRRLPLLERKQRPHTRGACFDLDR